MIRTRLRGRPWRTAVPRLAWGACVLWKVDSGGLSRRRRPMSWKNGRHILSASMIPSRTVVLAGALVVAAIGWFVAPAAFGRSLKAWELLVLAAASAGILQWQRS